MKRPTAMRAAPSWPAPVRSLAERIAERHGVTVDLIVSLRRSPGIVRARHELWRLVQDSWGLSYAETARIFDVDHTTLIEARRSFDGTPRSRRVTA